MSAGMMMGNRVATMGGERCGIQGGNTGGQPSEDREAREAHAYVSAIDLSYAHQANDQRPRTRAPSPSLARHMAKRELLGSAAGTLGRDARPRARLLPKLSRGNEVVIPGRQLPAICESSPTGARK